ncbi:MAG: HK97 family phage prohead protease [Acidobacteria bacterium]|nr:HK97 family phage prohead protease [Acidobacteriota bacterium]
MSPEPERRFVEFRADEGGIQGVVVRYGDRAIFGEWSEEFRAGALRFDDVIVNLQHDRGRPVARMGAGLTLTDGADALRAAIVFPDTSYAREARELVSARILRGFSVEFRAETDRWEGRHRIVEAAELTGLALVDRPAYPASAIAERFSAVLGARQAAQVQHRKYWV